MKTKFNGILTLLLAFVVQVSLAQTTVSGTVSEENGPLPGASVLVKGTTTGTQTDFDGNYSINASSTDVLVFSYVGFTTQEITVGVQSTINVALEADNQLDEVIVTAQGFKREKKSIGSAIAIVKSERLEAQPQADIGNILRGEVAGLNITTTNGISGSASNINIRGFTSISGSNQPLFIVDGVPFDAGPNGDPNSNLTDNLNQTSGFLDIDPNNIESVNVLKGLNAAVLYGQQGRNGVILITTKTGSGQGSSTKRKTEVTVTQSTFVSDVILPDYQNEFGGGFSQRFGNFVSNFGPSFNNNTDAEFGASFIERQGNTVFTPNPLTFVGDQSLLSGLEEFVTDAVAFAPATSVEDFFRTGSVNNTSINIRGGDATTNFSGTFSHLEDIGFTPGNTLRRNNASIGGSTKLSNKFTLAGSFNYAQTETDSPPIAAVNGGVVNTQGNGSSIFGNLIYTPRHIDLFALPFQALDGRSVFYRAGNDIQNPRWTAANANVSSVSRRAFGNITLSYEINDHWNLSNRVSLDTGTIFTRNGQNRGGVSGNVLGFLNTAQVINTNFDNNLTASAQYDINKDWNFQGIVGFNPRRTTNDVIAQTNTDQLVFGVLNSFNFVNQTSAEFNQVDNTLGAYTDLTFAYKDYLFLNGSGRNDWSSTLENGNNSIFYSGASVSFIPTAAFENIKGDVLSYLKLRGSFGESAGFPTPFQTRNILNLNARAFANPLNDQSIIATNSVSNTLANPGLLPERITEVEVGVDTRLFKNKLGLNVSVYNRTTSDLITIRNLDPATGFTNTTINSGDLDVEGIEIDFDFNPFSNSNGFSWRLNGNFNADETLVVSLPDGIDQIQVATAAGQTVANFAIAGQPFGVIQGFANQRDANGNLLINPADGQVLTEADLSIIGDPNPDWTSTLINSFSYKAVTFSFEWQYRHGGDFFSTTASTLLARGNIDIGVDRRDNFIIPGVFPNGQQNDVVLTAADLFFNGNLNDENRIYDGSTIRLNEASLSYVLPNKYLEKTPFGRLSFRASGNNLWFRAINVPREARFDTNSLSTGVGNGQGIEFLTGPSSRRYGLTVTATF